MDSQTFEITPLEVIDVDDPLVIAACNAMASSNAIVPSLNGIVPSPNGIVPSSNCTDASPHRRYAKTLRFHPYVDPEYYPYDEFNAALVVYQETIDIIRAIVSNTNPNNVPYGASINAFRVMDDNHLLIRYRVGVDTERCDIVHCMPINDIPLMLKSFKVRSKIIPITVYTMALRKYITPERRRTVLKSIGKQNGVLHYPTIKHLCGQHVDN